MIRNDGDINKSKENERKKAKIEVEEKSDIITAVQEQLFILSQSYSNALKQAEQGGDVGLNEVIIGSEEINNSISTTLSLISLLPSNIESDEEIQQLLQQEAKADAELKQARIKAMHAIEKIRSLRNNLANVVFKCE